MARLFLGGLLFESRVAERRQDLNCRIVLVNGMVVPSLRSDREPDPDPAKLRHLRGTQSAMFPGTLRSAQHDPLSPMTSSGRKRCEAPQAPGVPPA